MKLTTGVALALTGLVALSVLGRSVYVYTTSRTVTETFVRDSERVCSGSNEGQVCKFIAYGTNNEYENTDEWLFLKFNSTEVNKSLTKGNTCELYTYGWRIYWLSWYPNIIEDNCN